MFADVDNKMTIAQEEIFGPVLSIMPFDGEDQAVEMANDTVYGLTNYVQTTDPGKAKRLSRKLRSAAFIAELRRLVKAKNNKKKD